MKKLMLLLILGFTVSVFAQFKDSDNSVADVRNGIVAQQSSSILGFINPQNFSMHQSYSMSYSAFGGQGLALGVYTNDMAYNFSKNLNVQLEASVVNAPYSTLGKSFQNSINGIYLTRAAINYQPWKDVYISVGYNRLPYYNYYSPFSSYAGFYNGFGYGNPFGGW
jgi:hypothetical protein